MKTSEKGLDLIKKFEGLHLKAYICPAGKVTIGYGHTASAKMGQTITAEQADRLLRDDVFEAEEAVKRLVTAKLRQGQFDALVSFVFNMGASRLQGSTLRKKLNGGDDYGAANEFPRWVYARVDGDLMKLKGLERRRAAERELFLTA